jgi:hypothetical protein
MITWEETALVVGKIRTYHQPQDIGDATITSWHEALTDAGVTSRADAIQAVVQHYATPGAERWITPGDIIAGIRRIRRARLEHADQILPDVDPDNVQAWLTARRNTLQEVADGRLTPPEPPTGVPGPRLQTITAQAFPRPPRANHNHTHPQDTP